MSAPRFSPDQLELLELIEVREGTRIRLRVSPGAKSDAVIGVHGGALKLSVAAPPDRGRANDAVVRLLAEALGLPESAVEITSGHGSRSKIASVSLPATSIRERLATLSPRSPVF